MIAVMRLRFELELKVRSSVGATTIQSRAEGSLRD